jgi:hypothetical protein
VDLLDVVSGIFPPVMRTVPHSGLAHAFDERGTVVGAGSDGDAAVDLVDASLLFVDGEEVVSGCDVGSPSS